MFWKLTALSAASPVESILDKEDFTLEELLDEEDIIQECRALNSRLINFLRERAQVEQLLRFIVEESPDDADSKRAFKFPSISSEVLTSEIDVILKTLVDEEELMNLLFSFLEPNRSHSVMLAGYFSKVVICLMLRQTVPLMNYVKAHQNVFQQLVDLIGITSIMEVLIRLVGADDHVYPNHLDVMHWLADSNLLEMIVDKLSPSNSLEVHANAAETLCTIAQNASSPLATKLSSSRGQQIFGSPISVNPETNSTMLPRLGVSDEKILPTTSGQLRPPLGSHRLKKQNSTKKEEATTEQISSDVFARKGSKKTGLLGELFSCFGKNSSRVQALRLLEPSDDIQMNSHEEGDFNYKTGFVGSPQVDDCNPPMRSPKSHNVPYRPSTPSAPS